MAQWYSNELSGIASLPAVKPSATAAYGGRLKRYRASIPLSSQANGDTVMLAKIPAGLAFAFGAMATDTSLGTATLSVGTVIAGGALASGTYYYVVTTLTAAGESTKSNEVSVIVPVPGNGSVSLSWTAVTGATGYKLYRGTAAGVENVFYAPGNVTSYTDTGAAATNGTPPATNTATLPAPVQTAPSTATTGGNLAAATYYYKITALDANGETVGSNEQSQVTTGSTSTVTLNWGAVTGATSYRVYRGTAAGSENVYYAVAGGSSVTFTDTGAANTSASPPAGNTATINAPTQNAATQAGVPAKYNGAAQTLTALNAPALFGAVAAIEQAALTAEEVIQATIGAAALPASGNLVIDLYFSVPN